jgi:hypothetical protein
MEGTAVCSRCTARGRELKEDRLKKSQLSTFVLSRRCAKGGKGLRLLDQAIIQHQKGDDRFRIASWTKRARAVLLCKKCKAHTPQSSVAETHDVVIL